MDDRLYRVMRGPVQGGNGGIGYKTYMRGVVSMHVGVRRAGHGEGVPWTPTCRAQGGAGVRLFWFVSRPHFEAAFGADFGATAWLAYYIYIWNEL